jgi:hypothetical protein
LSAQLVPELIPLVLCLDLCTQKEKIDYDGPIVYLQRHAGQHVSLHMTGTFKSLAIGSFLIQYGNVLDLFEVLEPAIGSDYRGAILVTDELKKHSTHGTTEHP